MTFESINPPQFPTPIAPYSAGTRAGNTVYVSGTLALGEGGTVLHPGDAAAQTRHVLDTIRITLEASGASLADVALNHIFLTDWADYPAMNAVYARQFEQPYPARTTVAVFHGCPIRLYSPGTCMVGSLLGLKRY